MLISKITINKAREIKSIEININDNLIMYLSNEGESSPDGGGYPFSVVSRRMLMIKHLLWYYNSILRIVSWIIYLILI